MSQPDAAAAPARFSLVEKTGDLFNGTTASLCHCVSADLAMGRGIAMKFRYYFGKVAELRGQKVGPGGCAFIWAGTRYVLCVAVARSARMRACGPVHSHPNSYLVTKQRCFYKPTYDSLRASLVAMRKLMTQLGVTRLAMPRIGCSLDDLEWPLVRGHIEDVFAGTNVQVEVFVPAKP